jgi:hypothetical protein
MVIADKDNWWFSMKEDLGQTQVMSQTSMLALLCSVQAYTRSSNQDPREVLQHINELRLRYHRQEEQDKPSTRAQQHCQLTVHNLIYTSNKFEGSKLTKGQTMAILNEFDTASGSNAASIHAALADEPRQLKGQDPSPKREVLQHLLAARLLCSEPALPLTEDKIRRTHAILVDGLLDDDGEDIAAGSYRTEPISAKGRLFIEAEHVLLLLLACVCEQCLICCCALLDQVTCHRACVRSWRTSTRWRWQRRAAPGWTRAC